MPRALTAVVLTCTFAWSVPAMAQREDQRAAAQVLFEQGKALVERSSFAEACPKFAESLKLDRGLGTMLWLADCLENNGQTASAWVQFKEAAALAGLEKDAREKIARDRADKLEKRLSKLQLVVPRGADVRGLEIRRDGLPIATGERGLAVPLDPGVHAIVVTAPGRKAWTSNVTVPARHETVTITIPALEVDPSSPTPVPSPSPADKGTAPEPSSTGQAQRVVGLVVGGVGLVGAGVGAYFAFSAKSTYDDSNDGGHCLPDNQCDATGKALRDDAKTEATIATVAIGAGAAFIVGGALLYFTAPKARSVGLAPAIGPHGGGLTVFKSF